VRPPEFPPEFLGITEITGDKRDADVLLNGKPGPSLLGHTKPMHRKFVEIDSSFARQIMNEGVRLL